MNNKIKTLRLSGAEAYNFANQIYNPSIEVIERNKNILNDINELIIIRRNSKGLEAEIKDLDLSFLKEITIC